MFSKSKLLALGAMALAYYYTITLSQKIEGPTVTTEQGKLRGIVSFSRGGRKFYEYLGIPYAKPPVGDLRFEPPEPPEKWEGIRDASAYGSKCVQIDLLLGNLGGDEDCLSLNVFTKFKSKKKSTHKELPVIIYIHGGFFHNGGSDFWSPTYFMDEDIVFVTFNYRLASLGFLSTGDDAIRGNMGMKDQSMALRWIQANIRKFGGDPKRVTILGESAGAACSHLHMFSKMSKGLFNNVISLSGSALHFWAINKEPKRQTKRFAEMLGCPSEDSHEMKKCLKKMEAYDIVEAHREVLDPLRDEISIFKPTIETVNDDHTFLSEEPHNVLKSGNVSKNPWVIGVNSEEGLISSAALLSNSTIFDYAQNKWIEFVRRILWYPKAEKDGDKIRKFYFGDSKSDDPLENLDKYTNMISDRGFFVDTHHGALMQSNHSSVYLFYYTYIGEWSVINFVNQVRGTFPRLVEVGWAVISSWVNKSILGRSLPNYGASHSDELAMLFQMAWVSDVTPDSRDYQMSVDLVKLWASFATDDKKMKFRDVEWEKVNGTEPLNYLKIDNKPEIIVEPFSDRIKFWDSLHAQSL